MLTPTKDNILVKRTEREDTVVGGIFIPATLKRPNKLYKVIAVGPGKLDPKTGKRSEMTIKKDDKVLLKGFIGSDVIIDGETYLMVKEDHIAAVEVEDGTDGST